MIRPNFLVEFGLGQQLGRHVVDAHFVQRVALLTLGGIRCRTAFRDRQVGQRMPVSG